MRQRRACVMAGTEILLRHIHGMAENRTSPDQTRMRIDIEIARSLRKQAQHPFDLALIFAQMRLHEDTVRFAQQCAGRFELRLGTGRREARRDAIMLAAFLMPAADQGLAFVIAALGGVEQCFGCVSIHQHLARDHASVEARRFLEKGIHRLGMNGAIDRRSGGAGTQQFTQEELRRGFRIGLVGVFLLGHEGISIQPLQKL